MFEIIKDDRLDVTQKLLFNIWQEMKEIKHIVKLQQRQSVMLEYTKKEIEKEEVEIVPLKDIKEEAKEDTKPKEEAKKETKPKAKPKPKKKG